MKHIAFVTSKPQPELSVSDALVVPLLRHHDIEVRAIPWESKTNWGSFDMIIIRSAWDYPLRYTEFTTWLDMLEQHRARVWNSVNTLRWNSIKTYFAAIIDAHIPMVPTRIITDIHAIPDSFNPWETIVVKPAIGAWAFKTKKFIEKNKRLWFSHVRQLLKDGPVLVQPYMAEIENGEYSFIFFDRKFSHAVLKTPKKGEFRIQKAHGGTITPIDPPAEMIDTAASILDDIHLEPLMYARVDGICINGSFTLMEIELCEPDLFLDTCENAPQRFADCIIQYMENTPSPDHE